MEIVIQSHHATVTEGMQRSVRRGLARLRSRLWKPVSAVVRFEEDGPIRRVELVLQGRGRQLVAQGTGRFFGPALSSALSRLGTQLRRASRPAAQRVRRATKGRS